jgi:DNA (cytosine-5)-methyltransferase 1
VTMENVTRLRGMEVFNEFVTLLRGLGYDVDYQVIHGPKFGLPQERRRLVLMASMHGPVAVPSGSSSAAPTVRETIGVLKRLSQGETDPADPLHHARRLSDLNLRRMKASKPGGTWRDWPDDLLANCHRKESGSSFQAFYGRMTWDAPSPTITTLPYNFGAGRFGHPEQDRTLTLREAAMLQGFPQNYKFVPSGTVPAQSTVGRLIGNAVPPPFGRAIGMAFKDQVSN